MSNVLLPAKGTKGLMGSFLFEAERSGELKSHQTGHPLECFFLLLAARQDLGRGEIHSDTCF